MPTSTAQGTSMVCSLSPSGGDRKWLGALGHVNGLNWSFACPGGADQMSCTLGIPPQNRPLALTPGRIIEIWRGGSRPWEGILDEPVPDSSGWSITAHGAGTYGGVFEAEYTTWNIDNPLDRAITRGLRWTKPTFGSIGFLQSKANNATIFINDFLNNATIQAGLLWNVDSRQGNLLSIAAPPTTVDRILVCSVPSPRTLAAGLNTLWYTYVSAQAGNNQTITLAKTSNAAAIALHGNMENSVDFTPAGLMTGAAALANANNIMNQYIRANFTSDFTVRHGQWLTTGGQPIDLGTDTAYPHVVRLILTDFGYGGEIIPTPVTFVVGGYAYDEDAKTAKITPYQSYKSDLGTLLTAVVPRLRQ
jgi:hypothetical protein